MDFKKISNEELNLRLEKLARSERKLTHQSSQGLRYRPAISVSRAHNQLAAKSQDCSAYRLGNEH
ncbi:MAG: hypothetical protein IPM97_06895 [Bdellovibrionaceae bacterium]|nr:hypothetical protein [Pseudobdellovibrionaceae bacterium]